MLAAGGDVAAFIGRPANASDDESEGFAVDKVARHPGEQGQ